MYYVEFMYIYVLMFHMIKYKEAQLSEHAD